MDAPMTRYSMLSEALAGAVAITLTSNDSYTFKKEQVS